MRDLNDAGDSWAREHLSLRLSKERKERLAAIAAKMAPGTTPAQCVDRAVELALAEIAAFNGNPSFAKPLATSLADKPEEAPSRGKNDEILALISANISAPIRDISRKVEAVYALISAASELSDPAFEGNPGGGSVLALGDWLAHEAKSIGGSISKSAIVRATWEAKHRLSEAYVSLKLDGDLIAIDGKRVDSQLKNGASPRLLLDLIDADGPLASIDRLGAICLWCEPAGSDTWRVIVHGFTPSGAVGDALGELRA
jgi:hypothetical protein